MSHSDEQPPMEPTFLQPPPPPQTGDLPEMFGRYRILKPLGQGGMGAVYLAHDTQLDRPVALKVPRLQSNNPDQIERFYREARAAATFNHPNLCPVFDVGEVGGRHYLTMAYIEGRSLAELTRGGQSLPPQPVADLVRKLALALDEAHAKGVVHRDLKPANIMINRRNEPVVLDFGLARLQNDDSRLTGAGTLLGTPAYMPPEQVRGELDAVGPRSDIYSLGVVLYELLTNRLPFEGNVGAVISQVLTSEPPRPSQFRTDLDPALETICLKAMDKEPSRRFASMSDFAAALSSFLGGTSPTLPVETRAGNETAPLGASFNGPATQLIGQLMARLEATEERARTASRKPWIAAAALLLIGLLTAIALLVFRKDPPTPQPQMIIVYLNVPQLEKAAPGLKYVVVAGQRIDKAHLGLPIKVPEGTHSISLEDADGKVTDLGEVTLTKDDNEKAVEVTPERKVAVVEKREEPTKPITPSIEPVARDDINLAAAVNGGWLADVPSEYDNGKWASKHLIDSPKAEQYAAAGTGPISVVVGFKDGRLARISRVGVNPFTTDDKSCWVKKVAVEVSETYPFAGFKLVGEFEVPATADDFFWTLPTPQLARFVRFNFLTKQGGGGWMEAGEVMAYGSLVAEPPPDPTPLENTALASKGGKIARFSSEYDGSFKAAHLIDGNPGGSWAGSSNLQQMVVIQLARLSNVRYVAINPYSKEDPSTWTSEVEVLLSTTGKNDDFQSAGRLKMSMVGRDHALELKKPTPARFVKILFLTNHMGGWMEAHEVKVFADESKDECINLFDGDNLIGWHTVRESKDRNRWAVAAGVTLAEGKPERFDPKPGTGVLLNGGDGKGVNLLTKQEHGDCEMSMEFNLPKKGNSGVYLQGRYELQLDDSTEKKGKLSLTDHGSLYYIAAPRANACKPPGEWQSLQVVFRAPRFDAEGRKSANARVVKAVLNGVVIHENVELRPTLGALDTKEVARGPLMLQGDRGPAAFRAIRLKHLNED